MMMKMERLRLNKCRAYLAWTNIWTVDGGVRALGRSMVATPVLLASQSAQTCYHGETCLDVSISVPNGLVS